MRLLYFAWLRERIGLAEEEVAPPPEVTDVRGLVEWCRGRGEGYAAAFTDPSRIRIAVNQEAVGPDHLVRAGDEVAFFPPMTGG